MRTVQFITRYNSGAYVTNTVHGERASCTAGARDAAEKLCSKLFGAAGWTLEHLGPGDVTCMDRWQASGEQFAPAVQARFVPLAPGLSYRARAQSSARAGA